MIKGKIVLVPFPFDDLSNTKVRPALCLTELIGDFDHVVLAFISSQLPNVLLDSDILLNRNDTDFDMTGLKVTSTIRLHRIWTLAASVIKRELGILPPSFNHKISEKLMELFKLKKLSK